MHIMDHITVNNVAICLTFLISLIGLIINIWNIRISKEKMRLELYEKRFKIYSHVLNYCLPFVNQKSDIFDDEANFKNFIRAYRESRFLFSMESTVYSNIKEILQITTNVKLFQKNREESPYEIHQKIVNQTLNLNYQLTDLEDAMNPYLQFTVLTKWKSM